MTEITAERLREVLSYDAGTGKFVWAKTLSNAAPAGKETGCDSGNGYLTIKVDGKHYKAHRLAWLYVYGIWPIKEIDHIDGIGSNNRIDNLRECDRSLNIANMRRLKLTISGIKGVCSTANGRWRARIIVKGKVHALGVYGTISEAQEVYLRAAYEHFGEFARAG